MWLLSCGWSYRRAEGVIKTQNCSEDDRTGRYCDSAVTSCESPYRWLKAVIVRVCRRRLCFSCRALRVSIGRCLSRCCWHESRETNNPLALLPEDECHARFNHPSVDSTRLDPGQSRETFRGIQLGSNKTATEEVSGRRRWRECSVLTHVSSAGETFSI